MTTPGSTTLEPTVAELETVEGSNGRLGTSRVRLRERSLELLVTAGAFWLFAWALDRNGYGNTYYAAAIRSMTRSWHNFFYGSLDPGGWITVDKPPVAFWLQALSARVFGFNSWSLLLPRRGLRGAGGLGPHGDGPPRVGPHRRSGGRRRPRAHAGDRGGQPEQQPRRHARARPWYSRRGPRSVPSRTGARAGWRSPACSVASASSPSSSPLAWSCPGLARVPRRRAGPGSGGSLNCLLGAAVFVGVAIGWVALVDLRPFADRPWIGGSTDGTALDLVFGYNGFGRITGRRVRRGPVAAVSRAAAVPGGWAGGGGIDQFGGTPGFFRLFNNGMGDQVMWLAPIAAAPRSWGSSAASRRRTRARSVRVPDHVDGLDGRDLRRVRLRERHLPQLLRVASRAGARGARRHRRRPGPPGDGNARRRSSSRSLRSSPPRHSKSCCSGGSMRGHGCGSRCRSQS